jgi:hypothetical protein
MSWLSPVTLQGAHAVLEPMSHEHHQGLCQATADGRALGEACSCELPGVCQHSDLRGRQYVRDILSSSGSGGMSRIIRFGGTTNALPTSKVDDADLAALLGKISWKYVTRVPQFPPGGDDPAEEIARWAGRVWFHENELPRGEELRSFSLQSLERPFREYVSVYGPKWNDGSGLTLEEIWASQQLFSAGPMLALVADTWADLITERMDTYEVLTAQEIVWTLGAMCFDFPTVMDQGFNLLVSDGSEGHTIYVKGLNGIDFRHPRGDQVRRGWFSFHDPWPARSLLASYPSIHVLEDVSRPPLWLISPEDLAKVAVSYILPISILAEFGNVFKALEIAVRFHKMTASSGPLWLEPESDDPELPFATFFALNNGISPTTREQWFGWKDGTVLA